MGLRERFLLVVGMSFLVPLLWLIDLGHGVVLWLYRIVAVMQSAREGVGLISFIVCY